MIVSLTNLNSFRNVPELLITMKICPKCQTENFDANQICKVCQSRLDGSKRIKVIQTKRIVPIIEPPQQIQYYAAQPMNNMAFRCPFCQSNAGYFVSNKTSQAGWIFFWVLLLFLCIPLCWIGLFITETHQICRSCGMKLG